MRVSADDMFELYVNGKPMIQRLVRQPFWYDWDVIPVRLKAGENHLLFKVHNFSGAWRLRVRITTGRELTSPAYALKR